MCFDLVGNFWKIEGRDTLENIFTDQSWMQNVEKRKLR